MYRAKVLPQKLICNIRHSTDIQVEKHDTILSKLQCRSIDEVAVIDGVHFVYRRYIIVLFYTQKKLAEVPEWKITIRW